MTTPVTGEIEARLLEIAARNPFDWKRPDNIDAHPMRYHPVEQAIEGIILARFHQNKIMGYTLEMSVQIAEIFEEMRSAYDLDRASGDGVRAQTIPAWAVMRMDLTPPEIDVVWPTGAQAAQTAGFCSYPVEVVPVELTLSAVSIPRGDKCFECGEELVTLCLTCNPLAKALPPAGGWRTIPETMTPEWQSRLQIRNGAGAGQIEQWLQDILSTAPAPHGSDKETT